MKIDKIGDDLANAYNEGYKKALIDIAEKIDKEFTLASWYSKGSVVAFIKRQAGVIK